MAPALDIRGLNITITSAAPALASALQAALKAAGAHARVADHPDTVTTVTLLTEGHAALPSAVRHWQALLQSRAARGDGRTIIFLEPADAVPGAMSGLGGLARTLRKEWPETRFAAWTLACDSRDVPATATAALAAALGDARLTSPHHAQFTSIAEAVVPPANTQRPTGTWLITGGARGVTAACAVELARRAGPDARFILAGRSEAAPWPEGIAPTDDLKALRAALALRARDAGERLSPRDIDRTARRALAGREIAATLGAIAAAGGRASYTAIDVADTSALRVSLAAIARDHGPVTALVHGAGVLADRLAADKTEVEVRSVFAPKVDGLCHLLAALPPANLSHLGLFSSASALFGNTGQADYAMANQVLVNLARNLHAAHPALRVAAFDWGPWEGGMVDDTLAAHFKSQGIALIPVAEGARIFADQLLGGDRQVTELLIGDAWSRE